LEKVRGKPMWEFRKESFHGGATVNAKTLRQEHLKE
jgi:hypothetical protein